MNQALTQIAFREPDRAAANMERIAKRAPSGVQQALITLLADSPDPDSALNLFERLAEGASDELLRMLSSQRRLVHYAIVIFGHSHFLGETLIRNPDLFHALARDRNLERSNSREDFRENFARFRSRSFETDISVMLARFKRREYIRIVLRDVLGIAHLADTTAEISALSDVLMEEALREANANLRHRFGVPQAPDATGRLVEIPFAILSMGKLGGNELNYSSDVDLLFLYGDGNDSEVESEGAPITSREYFVRLAQSVTEILSRVTAEGAVFRIDLRLRPQGNEGEPAAALSRALRYYSTVAHDWELQALIKVRFSAGDQELARSFAHGIQPYVYTRNVNFAAIETALNSLEKISAWRRRDLATGPYSSIDVKIDRGGIRDIEFLVQCLQRVYGGSEPWLRSGGTLFSLQKLHDKGNISGKEFHDLNSAYTFLRKLEHRLQLRRGQQVHRLPESSAELEVIRASVCQGEARALPASGFAGHDFVAQVRAQMDAVAAIYTRIIHSQKQQKEQPSSTGEFVLSATPGFSGHEFSFNQIVDRIAVDSPELHAIVVTPELSPFGRRNLQRFLAGAMTSAERYGAVLRSPQAVALALPIFAKSSYLSDVMARHPEVISTIASDPAMTMASHAESVSLGFGEIAPVDVPATDAVLDYIADAGIPRHEKLDLLRQHFRQRMFHSAAEDVIQPRNVYESLAQTTAVADSAIATALAITGDGAVFAVLALGRLGTCEFDWASDADLIFVRSGDVEAADATRVAQRLVEALATYTRVGNVVAVDARLRPRGGEGELVTTASELGAYFAGEAHAWEALTYTKLRYVAGSRELADAAIQVVSGASKRFAANLDFMKDVREMRARLEAAESDSAHRGAERLNLKTSPGAFYDIDFILNTMQVRHGIRAATVNTHCQLLDLAARSLISVSDAAVLQQAAELMRSLDHAVRLVTGRSQKSLPENEGARRAAVKLAWRMMRTAFDDAEDIHRELTRTFAQVREIYDRILNS